LLYNIRSVGVKEVFDFLVLPLIIPSHHRTHLFFAKKGTDTNPLKKIIESVTEHLLFNIYVKENIIVLKEKDSTIV